MASGKSWRIGAALGIGLAVVLAGPVLLLWSQFRPQPWDWRTLGVRFESARYEGTALVFTYRVENRTRWSVRLIPDLTRVLARQPAGRPPVGSPALQFPLDLAAHSAQRMEVRLELPVRRAPTMWSELSEDHAKRLLQLAMPEAEGLSLPMPPPTHDLARKPVAQAVSPEVLVETTLEDLNGFELINESKGVHLVLPRGW